MAGRHRTVGALRGTAQGRATQRRRDGRSRQAVRRQPRPHDGGKRRRLAGTDSAGRNSRPPIRVQPPHRQGRADVRRGVPKRTAAGRRSVRRGTDRPGNRRQVEPLPAAVRAARVPTLVDDGGRTEGSSLLGHLRVGGKLHRLRDRLRRISRATPAVFHAARHNQTAVGRQQGQEYRRGFARGAGSPNRNVPGPRVEA